MDPLSLFKAMLVNNQLTLILRGVWIDSFGFGGALVLVMRVVDPPPVRMITCGVRLQSQNWHTLSSGLLPR